MGDAIKESSDPNVLRLDLSPASHCRHRPFARTACWHIKRAYLSEACSKISTASALKNDRTTISLNGARSFQKLGVDRSGRNSY
jgi:hypothetical protein